MKEFSPLKKKKDENGMQKNHRVQRVGRCFNVNYQKKSFCHFAKPRVKKWLPIALFF